ncbi:MAG: hypothetical protein AAGH19_00535 [Pseudomonadota bacterium]
MFIKTLLAATTLLLSQAVVAEVRGVNCNGCSTAKKEQAAIKAVRQGTVYVFDERRHSVTTYRVFTEVIDVRPYTSWTSAVKIRTDRKLETRYRHYLKSVAGLRDAGMGGTIVLPPDFPVRSVAGVLVDPAYATTFLENHLLSLPEHDQAALTLTSLMFRATKLKLPMVDLQDIIASVTLNFEFPDGSSMDFSIEFTVNQLTGRARTELTPEGNAMAEDGRPAPTSALGFRNREFRDNNGSLAEWIALARLFDISISDNSGTKMTCWVKGNEIFCTVSYGQ